MPKICLFAGTSDGRRLVSFLEKQDAELTVCVATEYGKELLPESDKIKVSDVRLTAEEITRLLKEEQFDLVIDATHPYAVQITENISIGCRATGTPCKRLIRHRSAIDENMLFFSDVSETVNFLNTTEGNILLTTGSKDLAAFSSLLNYSERVYARVLPMQSSFEACIGSGLKPSHIIAMQGPFSKELNKAMIRTFHAEWLVTKESGNTGGFAEKSAAAQECRINLIVIGRPSQQEGLDEGEMIRYLCSRFGFINKPIVQIVGIGLGSRSNMTLEAVRCIEKADILIGSERALDAASLTGKQTFRAISPHDIAEFIHSHPEFTGFTILMSGDSGFYSGTRRLLPLLENCETSVYPGISSLSYLCSRIGISYEDTRSVSLHGRNRNIIPIIKSNTSVFILTGGENNVSSILRQISESDIDNIRITVGERLGYPDERIRSGTLAELSAFVFDPLSVLLIHNDHADRITTHGIPDHLFRRAESTKGIIPMTKNEIRSIILSKLSLTEHAICWDIGSGTGSVSVEMALQARLGSVYGIEKDEDAVKIAKENAAAFSVENLILIHGTAPEICKDLPDPTHVFIGGSDGNLESIIALLISKKIHIRVAVTAITLESISELYEISNEHPEFNTEITMIQTAQGKKAGKHQLMIGGNPVYIFIIDIPGKDE